MAMGEGGGGQAGTWQRGGGGSVFRLFTLGLAAPSQLLRSQFQRSVYRYLKMRQFQKRHRAHMHESCINKHTYMCSLNQVQHRAGCQFLSPTTSMWAELGGRLLKPPTPVSASKIGPAQKPGSTDQDQAQRIKCCSKVRAASSKFAACHVQAACQARGQRPLCTCCVRASLRPAVVAGRRHNSKRGVSKDAGFRFHRKSSRGCETAFSLSTTRSGRL